MKRFILFFAHSSMLIFVFLSFDFPVFGQNEDVEIDLSFLDSLETALIITDKKKEDKDLEAIKEMMEGEQNICILIVEQNAVFDGGMDYFKEIVNNQMRFSDTMKEGRVFLQFVVDKTGKVSEIKVVKGLSEENDKEALRIMNLISEHYDWIPAKQREKTVKVRMSIPILFKRQEQLKSNAERIYKQ